MLTSTRNAIVDWIESEERLLAISKQWDQLAEEQELPFARHAWFVAWWRAFGGDLRICTAWEGDELVAVFPLVRRGRRHEAMANVHSPVFRPFASNEHALRLVVERAVAAGDLAVTGLPADDPALTFLVEASRRAGRLTLVQPDRSPPFVTTRGEFGDYLATLPRKQRRDLERRRRKLDAEHDPVFSIDTPLDELEHCLALESAGWKGKRGTAIENAAETREFYTDLAPAFDERFRLATISVGGEVIAFDYVLVDGNRWWVLKGGYDERFRNYAPGLLLTLAQIAHCFEQGLDSLELAGDAAEWKAKFASGEHRLVAVGSYRRRSAPSYAYRRFLRPRLRRAYRRLFPATDRG